MTLWLNNIFLHLYVNRVRASSFNLFSSSHSLSLLPFCYHNFIAHHQLCTQFCALIRLLNGRMDRDAIFFSFVAFRPLLFAHFDSNWIFCIVRIFQHTDFAYGFHIFIVIFNICTVFHVCRRHKCGIKTHCPWALVQWQTESTSFTRSWS